MTTATNDFEDLREGTATSGEGAPKDETYKLIRGKKDVPDVGKGIFMFRMTRVAKSDFLHRVQFWLNVAKKQDGSFLPIPKCSPLPFSAFLVDDGRGNKRFGYANAVTLGDKLSQLAVNKHAVIARTKYADKNGELRLNINPIHAMPIQVVDYVRDGAGNFIKDPKTGVAQIKVLPDEVPFEMWQALWEQFLDIVSPRPEAATDLGGIAEVKKKEELPTKDLTKILWYVIKEKKEGKGTGDPKMDVVYKLKFSSSVIFTDADIPTPVLTEDLLNRAYPIITEEELAKIVAKANNGWVDPGATATTASESSEDSPESYGEHVDLGQGEAQKDPPPPADGAVKLPF